MKTCPQNKNAVKITRPQPAAKNKDGSCPPSFYHVFSTSTSAWANAACALRVRCMPSSGCTSTPGTRPASRKRAPSCRTTGSSSCARAAAFSAHPPPKALRKTRLVCGHNRRRAYSQYIGFITPCIGIGSLFQQASNALCNEIGIASEPFLRIICSQHHHQCIQGRMAHHTGRKVGKAAQPFGDGVVKHRGTARQALLNHGPARPQQSLYTARISLCFPIAAVPLRVVSIRV